jgi:hypothetical protein
MINKFELHVDDIDVVLIDFLFMLQDFITSREFSEFEFHFLLFCELFQLL